MAELLHKELSYLIHGAAIEVRKDFGPGHKEKLYQTALVQEFGRRKIQFVKEPSVNIYSPKDGQKVGLYRPDFIVDDKIIVELKAEKFVSNEELKRLYDYLRNSEYELAYLINFASSQLMVKRVIFTNNRKPFKLV
ncbi:MAG TPA: GxxExxY protein [Methylomirabilota bacterium]|jgi:GxxExxY protein|nr:GxxExxY protein [Methylomirabilota bacterium]